MFTKLKSVVILVKYMILVSMITDIIKVIGSVIVTDITISATIVVGVIAVTITTLTKFTNSNFNFNSRILFPFTTSTAELIIVDAIVLAIVINRAFGLVGSLKCFTFEFCFSKSFMVGEEQSSCSIVGKDL